MTDGGSSIPEVHALLATLVASKPAGRFAETGTARWQCRSCQVLRAEVVHGHWLDVLPQRAPFDLLFADGGLRDTEGGFERSISLLAPGGFLVKDDMSPRRPIDGDEIREWLFREPRLIATEVLTTPSTAAIVAVRR